MLLGLLQRLQREHLQLVHQMVLHRGQLQIHLKVFQKRRHREKLQRLLGLLQRLQ
jgi:hypothetical protein